MRRVPAQNLLKRPTRRGRGQMVRMSAVAVLALALVGCASLDRSYARWVDGQNQRKIRGCYDVDLTFAGGGGIGAGVNGAINARGIVVTGGMTLKKCGEYKKILQESGGQL